MLSTSMLFVNCFQGRHFILFAEGGGSIFTCRKKFVLVNDGNVENWPSVPVTLEYLLR